MLKGGGHKEIRDPAKQVRRACRALKKRVEQICGNGVADKIRFATAVAFPHCVFRDQPPSDLPVQTIITSDDLPDIETAVARAYGAFGAAKAELTVREFDDVRRALAPGFTLYEPIKISVDHAAQSLSQLTRQQMQILRGFGTNNRAIVHGVAGSGKTMLALERARKFASEGKSVLFTCFNAELATWLSEHLSQDSFCGGGKIASRNFHGLAADVLRAGGGSLQPVGDIAKYWDEIVPDQMAAVAAAIYADEAPFDALVVDEAQDFSPGWWDALAYLIGLSDAVPIWAFLDRDQSLRRDPVDPPLPGAAVLHLDFNCRNTRRIVAFASEASKILAEPFEMAPLGRPVRFAIANSQAAIPGVLQSEIRRLTESHRLRSDQIALIGPTGWRKGILAKWVDVANIPIIESAQEWRQQGGLLCTTARSFKGLEADVVILYDLAGCGPTFTECDLYVALTRARSHLVVIGCQGAFTDLLQTVSARTTAQLDEASLA
jgi:hypothetical protein